MKTSKIVREIGKQAFQDAVDAAIALGYTDTSNPVTFIPSTTYVGDVYVQELVNPGTNTPTVTVDTVLMEFGNVTVGEPSILPLAVEGRNLTGNIVVTSSNAQFVVGTSPMIPDEDNAVDANNNITFTPASDNEVEQQAYLTLETEGGQSIVVIVTGTGIPEA